MNKLTMSKSGKRREDALRQLKLEGRLSIQEAMLKFDISEATARRDMDALAELNGVIRTIGGVQYESYSAMKEATFHEKRNILLPEKEAIAEKAASLVADGDIIALTGGTTTFLIARKLKDRRNLTVVTNAVNIAMELSDSEDVQVVLTGGVMRKNSFELCGPLAEKTVEDLNITKMFLGVDGFTAAQGFTTYSELEAHIGKLMIARSAQTIAVFDQSKVGKASIFTIAPLSAVQACVTDAELGERELQQLREHGLTVHLVRKKQTTGEES
ncbi:DeoR/GlpR family DNA-binding transcription regulator [Paenibacillus sp. HB172176]|uniref:DeoR/GlpR family DNA-binding transcription regulator n=1 Tax=Paenibacillus sp. HB172176 TaxID=2493690 RepID=UPI0014393781|nr:DeoR/GlpR family DNA-binding transcription regulator [Paenibacillus sp. HB172176]